MGMGDFKTIEEKSHQIIQKQLYIFLMIVHVAKHQHYFLHYSLTGIIGYLPLSRVKVELTPWVGWVLDFKKK